MKIDVNVAGVFTDLIKQSVVTISDVKSRNDMLEYLNSHFPAVSKYKKITIINKRIVSSNVALQDDDSVTIMPLYVGG